MRILFIVRKTTFDSLFCDINYCFLPFQVSTNTSSFYFEPWIQSQVTMCEYTAVYTFRGSNLLGNHSFLVSP